MARFCIRRFLNGSRDVEITNWLTWASRLWEAWTPHQRKWSTPFKAAHCLWPPSWNADLQASETSLGFSVYVLRACNSGTFERSSNPLSLPLWPLFVVTQGPPVGFRSPRDHLSCVHSGPAFLKILSPECVQQRRVVGARNKGCNATIAQATLWKTSHHSDVCGQPSVAYRQCISIALKVPREMPPEKNKEQQFALNNNAIWLAGGWNALRCTPYKIKVLIADTCLDFSRCLR